MRYYFPKSRHQFKQTYQRPMMFGRFWNMRRYTSKSIWNIIYVLWFWAFLLFAWRVGTIAFLSLGSMARDNDGLRVHLPSTYSGEKYYHSSKGYSDLLLYVDFKGNIVCNSETLKIEDLSKFFYMHWGNNQNAKVFLRADKNVPMSLVQQIHQAIRSTPMKEIIYCTLKSE